MKLALMLLLNLLLVSLFLYWLGREYRRADQELRRWLLPTLAWRVLLTGISSIWPSPDLAGVAKWGKTYAAYLWSHPGRVFATLQGTSLHGFGEKFSLYKWSGTLFFNKVLIVMGFASGGVLVVNALYISLLCFIGCWLLVRTLQQAFHATLGATAGIAFLLWPSVVWWTSGLTKETLLVGSAAGLLVCLLPVLYGSQRPRSWSVLLRLVISLLLIWVMARIRLFFALPFLGCLLGLTLVRLATRRGWVGYNRISQVGSLLVLLVVGGILAGTFSIVYLGPNHFTHEVALNYQHGLLTSQGRPHLEYADWHPTYASMLRHAPLAVLQVLSRPWLGESMLPLYLAISLENIVLLIMLGIAIVAVWQGRAGPLPSALVAALLVYCMLLAAFIGLSTPNLGTLSRYRAALLPWLLLLLLQNDYALFLLKRLGQWARRA
jgi:hypothetical protein